MKAIHLLVLGVLAAIAVGIFLIAGNTSKDEPREPTVVEFVCGYDNDCSN